MAAKQNNATRVKTDRAKKSRRRTAANDEALSAGASTPAELVPPQAAEAAEPSAPEPPVAVPSSPAGAGPIVPAPTRPGRPDKAKKLSALDAAAQVLGEAGRPMSCAELITAMAARGYWKSPKGLTPSATLYSALLRELKSKGDNARFVKAERGKFMLKSVP